MKRKLKKPRNTFEKKLYAQLKKAKCDFKYETERIPYVLSGHYLPDFILKTKTGFVYIEGKGYFRPEAKRKMIAVKRQHPNKDIRLVFYKFNKNYIRWAERYGFRYAIGKIPVEWLDGF